MAGCVLFSQKPIYLRYVSKIAIFVPKTHFCQGYRMGKASKSTQTCKVRQKSCDILKQALSYTQNTSKYPEKLLKLWKLCGKLHFLWWLGGSRIYICVSAWKKICPWRHSKCWLPNSFILGGGRHSKFWNAGKMQFSSVAVKKTYKHLFQSVTVTGIPVSGPSRR